LAKCLAEAVYVLQLFQILYSEERVPLNS